MALVASCGLLRMVRRLCLQQDVGHRLSDSSTVAPGAGYIWHFTAEEEVFQPNLLSPELDKKSAVSLSEAFMYLEYSLCG
ncbi:hypothetical protein PMIN01_11787 [Paraphaeosphaeria minitans]|uniref:Uncharacterized protein n=1 Tax=Paraphaeosphaeria minitans TaxID=565426 RepID=A0A9P6G6P4_9PLEO|nr:hypothetical protein PMIN01_11787 [Paraphaeosphaeria minitans]